MKKFDTKNSERKGPSKNILKAERKKLVENFMKQKYLFFLRK